MQMFSYPMNRWSLFSISRLYPIISEIKYVCLCWWNIDAIRLRISNRTHNQVFHQEYKRNKQSCWSASRSTRNPRTTFQDITHLLPTWDKRSRFDLTHWVLCAGFQSLIVSPVKSKQQHNASMIFPPMLYINFSYSYLPPCYTVPMYGC